MNGSSLREGWRVFPYDEGASEGERFSRSFVPRASGRGRFDLPLACSGVLYVAETPEHAVAEVLHPWRTRSIDDRHLTRAGRPLALVRVAASGVETTLADLCDPHLLGELGIAPDRLASRHRKVTQPLARRLWDRGFAGLRWWSRFCGDWHTLVLFTARETPVDFGDPQPLDVTSSAVGRAADALGIEVLTSPSTP